MGKTRVRSGRQGTLLYHGVEWEYAFWFSHARGVTSWNGTEKKMTLTGHRRGIWAVLGQREVPVISPPGSSSWPPWPYSHSIGPPSPVGHWRPPRCERRSPPNGCWSSRWGALLWLPQFLRLWCVFIRIARDDELLRRHGRGSGGEASRRGLGKWRVEASGAVVNERKMVGVVAREAIRCGLLLVSPLSPTGMARPLFAFI
jgi:hypothetical protein